MCTQLYCRANSGVLDRQKIRVSLETHLRVDGDALLEYLAVAKIRKFSFLGSTMW